MVLWQVLRRLLILVISTAAASFLTFWVLFDGCAPARTRLGIGASESGVAQLCADLGLDRPMITQYLEWAGGILHGNFGTSYISGRALGPQILDQLSVTLWLVAGAMIVAVVLAVPWGLFSALGHRKIWGTLLSAGSQIGVAVPAFLAAILLVLFFSVRLGWLPPNGYQVPGADFVGFARYMVLPWLSLGIVQGAVLARYVRSAVLDESGQDYLRTARSKGLTRLGALVRHGLRNASIPVLTVIGVQLVTILVGAVVVEYVFAIPGIGAGLADAAKRQDLLNVQGIVVVLVVIALVVSFLVDLAYTLIDPRLRSTADGGRG